MHVGASDSGTAEARRCSSSGLDQPLASFSRACFPSAIRKRRSSVSGSAPWAPAAIVPPATRLLLAAPKRMSDSLPPDSSCEVVRSQPQPASMSTSSQYYRSRAHYQHFPSSNHEHMYALAATWQQDPNHDSYAGPLPAPLLHYTQAGVDSASLHPPSAPPPWAAGYVRPEHHEWNQQGASQAFTARSPPQYAHAHAEGPAPLPNPAGEPQYQHPLSPQEHSFPAAERFHELRVSSVSAHSLRCPALPSRLTRPQEAPAHAAEAPFGNHGQKLHSISRLSQTTPLHANSPQAPLPPAAAWDAHHQFPSHTGGNPLPTSVISARQNSSSAAPWPLVEPGEASTATTVYERLPNVGQDWDLVQVQPAHGVYPQHHSSVDPLNNPVAQLPGSQRPAVKKKAAKVPSSFVERQEKLKVSKRRGPLHEKQREKTHTMRKTKRICVRCRFYKSGVRT